MRRDGAAAADDDADVLAALLAQHVHHVREVFVVPALIGADGDAVRIFLDRGAHDVRNAAVVAEVHDLRALRLQQAADHVDGGIVPVEQRCGGDEAQRRGGGRRIRLWRTAVPPWGLAFMDLEARRIGMRMKPTCR